MKKNKIIYIVGFFGFVGLTVYALMNELTRETAKLKNSISGVILAGPRSGGDIVKTDNAHIMLFDPDTLELVATHINNPFLPPTTFNVGQEDTSLPLKGSYRLMVITDKDGNLNKITPGEVIGPLSEPILLGTEEVEYTLDRPFTRLPPEFSKVQADKPENSIQGTITVAENLQSKVSAADRLVIMLFDPQQGRPVAIKMIPGFQPPLKFSIGQSNAMGGQALNGKYSLRILTDKNNQPFQSVSGEIIGRSKQLISLGTNNLNFVLDQPYVK